MIILVRHVLSITALMNELPTLHLSSRLPAFCNFVNFILHKQLLNAFFPFISGEPIFLYIYIYISSNNVTMAADNAARCITDTVVGK